MRIASRLSGFSLVEVTLALGIMAFCLIALFGLVPVGLTSNQNSIETTGAAGVASTIFSDLRATASASTTSQRFGFTIPAVDQSASLLQTIYFTATGEPTGAVNAGPNTGGPYTAQSRYRATVDIIPPKGAGVKMATMVRIMVTWPALADSNPVTAPAKYIGSFEAVTALNRN